MADNYIGFIIVIIIIKVLFIISYLAFKCCKSSKGQTFSQTPAAGSVVVQSYPTNPLHQGIFIIQNPQNPKSNSKYVFQTPHSETDAPAPRSSKRSETEATSTCPGRDVVWSGRTLHSNHLSRCVGVEQPLPATGGRS